MIDAVLRRLARDHWVRLHGTPRVTVLGGGDLARQLWGEWTRVMQLDDAILLDGELDASITDATRRAAADPTRTIGVLAESRVIAAWRAGRTDRLAALVDEGLLEIPDAPCATPPGSPVASSGRGTRAPPLDARSAAEAALFEALEGTAATAGRFQLNARLAVRFGPAAAEVDLMSRADRIAIEIDGYHHFTEPDAYRRDRRKDLLLQMQDLVVIRVLAEDVLRDPRGSVAMVCQALAYRLGGRPS